MRTTTIILCKTALFILVVFVFNCISLQGQEIQKNSNIWYFGNRAGIDFNTSPPTALTDGQLNTQEGVSTISDRNGILLFYTDGITIWDRNHEAMPNANGTLNGHPSSTQSGIIIPHPGNSDLYYIFTTDELAGSNGLAYTIVDISLPGNGTTVAPLGNVVNGELNIALTNPVTEKICGIVKGNSSGYWLVAHGWNNNRFYSFDISCNGLDLNPVITDIGNIHAGGGSNVNAVGYMKPTIDGKKLALVNRNNNSIDVYDFDIASGEVSNELVIRPNDNLLYGIEFTLDGDYLFIGGSNILSRFSFITNEIIKISIDKSTPFFDANGIRAIQLGPDENLYVSIRNWDHLSVINNPTGLNPSLTVSQIYLDPDNTGRICRFGLPNIFYYDFYDSTESITTTVCSNEQYEYNGEFYLAGTTNEVNLTNNEGCDSTIILIVEAYPVSEETFEFDACTGGFYDFNGIEIPAGSEQSFNLTSINGCDSIINVIVNEVDLIEENIEISLCEGEMYFYENIEYPPGTDTLFQFIDQFGCDNIVSLQVALSPPLTFELQTNDACWNENDGSIIIENINGGIQPFEFSIDSQNYASSSMIDNLAPGNYQITVRDFNQCLYNQTFEILESPELVIEYQEPILGCDDDSILLRVDLFNFELNEVEWKWSNGSLVNSTYITQPGTYSLEVSNDCQTLLEEINVALEMDSIENYIYIPNIFSPNRDGINDVFKLFIRDDVELTSYEIHIYDRWGSKVFQSNDINYSWDGHLLKRDLQPGVYVWWLNIEAVACKRSINFFEKGNVTAVW